MRHCLTACCLLVVGACLAGPALATAEVTHKVVVVNGVRADRYTWTDSKGLQRSVSLKRQTKANPGNGGYAVQMTYQVGTRKNPQTVVVNADTNDGFGYFVSHERYRTFEDDTSATIAGKIFGTDDSPLGRGFAVRGRKLAIGKPGVAGHQFTMTYPRYGTIEPIRKNASGEDVKKLPLDPGAYRRYSLPVVIKWFFQTGTDHPRIQTQVGFGDVPGPDRVNFDLRGPYGVMLFGGGPASVVRRLAWGDRFHFRATTAPVTRGTPWVWQTPNKGGRYLSLVAGKHEMGLFEPKPFAKSSLADGYSGARGLDSSTYNGGKGCPLQDQLLPCDWEWPYQSLQYSLPNDRVNPTNYKKMAWGSTAYYGTGNSLKRVYDSPTTSRAFNGWPKARKIVYNTCVVLGKTTSKGLTRTASANPRNYRCAHLP